MFACITSAREPPTAKKALRLALTTANDLPLPLREQKQGCSRGTPCEPSPIRYTPLAGQRLRSNRGGYQLLLRRRYWGSFEMLNQP
jgi:hypothetical protein